LEDLVVDDRRMVAVVQEQALVRELRQLDARSPGQRMRRREEGDDAFVVEDRALQLAGIAGEAEEADVDAALPQSLDLIPRRQVVAEHGDAGGARLVADA